MQNVSKRAKVLAGMMALIVLLCSVIGVTHLTAMADDAATYVISYNKANFTNARPDGTKASINDDCIGGYSPYGTVAITITLPEGKSYDKIALEAAAPDIPSGETREVRVYVGTSPYADGTNNFNDSLGYTSVGLVHTGGWGDYAWSDPATLTDGSISGTVTLYLANRTGDKNANLRDIKLYEVASDTPAYYDVVISENYDNVTTYSDIAKNDDCIGGFDEYDCFSITLTLPEGKAYNKVALETATTSGPGPIRVYVDENPVAGGNWSAASDNYAGCQFEKSNWGVWVWSSTEALPTTVSGTVTLYIGNRTPGACNVRSIRLYEAEPEEVSEVIVISENYDDVTTYSDIVQNSDCIGSFDEYDCFSIKVTAPEGVTYTEIALETATTSGPGPIRVYVDENPVAGGNWSGASSNYAACEFEKSNWGVWVWSSTETLPVAISGEATLYIGNRTPGACNVRSIKLTGTKAPVTTTTTDSSAESTSSEAPTTTTTESTTTTTTTTTTTATTTTTQPVTPDEPVVEEGVLTINLPENKDNITDVRPDGTDIVIDDCVGSFDEYDCFSIKLTLPEGKSYDKIAIETASNSGPGPIRVYVNENPMAGGNWDGAGSVYATCFFNKTDWGVWDWSDAGEFAAPISGEVTLYIGNRTPGACNVRNIKLYETGTTADDSTTNPSEEGAFELLVKDDKDAFKAENGANTVVNDDCVGGMDEYNVFSVTFTLPEGKTYDRIALYTASPDASKNGLFVYVNQSPVQGGNWNLEMAHTSVKRPVTSWTEFKWTNPVELYETVSGTVTLYIGNRDTGACNVGGIKLFEVGAEATTYTTAAPTRPSVDANEGDQVLFAEPTWEVVEGAGTYNEASGVIGGYGPGAVIKIPAVDFGATGYSGISILYSTPDKLVPKDCQILIDEFPAGDVIGEMRLSATESNWNENIYAFADSEMYQKVTGVHDVYVINGTSGNFNVQAIKLTGVWTGSEEESSEPEDESSAEESVTDSTTTSEGETEPTEGESSEDAKNPETGVPGSIAVAALAVAACAAVAITRKKK